MPKNTHGGHRIGGSKRKGPKIKLVEPHKHAATDIEPPHKHRKVWYKRVYPGSAFSPLLMIRYGWTCTDENGGCGAGYDTYSLAAIDDLPVEIERALR